MADTSGLWLSISDIAKRKGVSKQTISEKVAKLGDKIEIRPGKNRTKLINLAQYDRLVGEIADLGKELAAETARQAQAAPVMEADQPLDLAPLAPAPYSTAQADRARYESELKKLDLAERRGQLVAISDLTEALASVGDTIAQILARLPLRADDVSAATGKDGIAGCRVALKTIAFDMSAAITTALRGLEHAALAAEANGPLTFDVVD